MNKIGKLMTEFCPNGVPFKTLGEVCKRNSGTNITAAIMKELHKDSAPIRIFAGGSTVADVDYGDIPDKDVITETSVIVKSRGYIGFEYYEKPFSHKNEFWSYSAKSDEINLKFLYYFLVSISDKMQEKAKATSVKIPQLCVADTDNLQIPLPPLVVQSEIVSILDKFTKLEAELEAELEARKKQYEYYRNALLTFTPPPI